MVKTATKQRHLYAVTVPKPVIINYYYLVLLLLLLIKTDNIQTVSFVGKTFIVIRFHKTHF